MRPGVITAALVIGTSVSGCAVGPNGVGVNLGTIQEHARHRAVASYVESSRERSEFNEFVNKHSNPPKAHPHSSKAHHSAVNKCPCTFNLGRK